MKILLVSASILPQSGGSSVIVENLARNFSRDQMVVLGAKGAFTSSQVNRNSEGPEFYYFFSELSFMGRGARFFDWFRHWRLAPLIKRIRNVIKEREITHVIGVYPNPFYCLAAARAAKEHGIPFSAYFHNTYVENTAISDPSAAGYQEEIFENAKDIFVMSNGMKDFYERKYGLNKFVPLVHTFNQYPDQSTYTGLPGVEKEVYSLVAIGNFNESNLEATRRLIAAIKNNPKYRLSIYTHVPKLLLQNRGMDMNQVIYKGAVHPDQMHTELQEFDICILTHGFKGGYGEIEYETIFPTRTIPLLLSGKPILVHSPKKSFLNRFIADHQCAELIDMPKANQIVDGLDRIISDKIYQQTLVNNAMKAAGKFYGATVADKLIEVLKSQVA